VNGLCIPGPTPASHTGGMIQRFDPKSGKLETVYDSCDGRRLIGPNDLVFDKQGGLWFTDHGCSTPEGRKFGAVYYAKPDGSHISRQRDHLISPNGVGLSPEEDVAYVADTQLGRLWAFDIASPGVLGPPAGFAPGRVICNLPGYQLLDSLAVEAGGKVCVATIINGGITVFSPDGRIVRHVPMPDPMLFTAVPIPEPMFVRLVPMPEPMLVASVPMPEPILMRLVPSPEPISTKLAPTPEPESVTSARAALASRAVNSPTWEPLAIIASAASARLITVVAGLACVARADAKVASKSADKSASPFEAFGARK